MRGLSLPAVTESAKPFCMFCQVLPGPARSQAEYGAREGEGSGLCFQRQAALAHVSPYWGQRRSESALLPPASASTPGAVRALAVSPFTTRVWPPSPRGSGGPCQRVPFCHPRLASTPGAVRALAVRLETPETGFRPGVPNAAVRLIVE